jgi:hypothetical protein
MEVTSYFDLRGCDIVQGCRDITCHASPPLLWLYITTFIAACLYNLAACCPDTTISTHNTTQNHNHSDHTLKMYYFGCGTADSILKVITVIGTGISLWIWRHVAWYMLGGKKCQTTGCHTQHNSILCSDCHKNSYPAANLVLNGGEQLQNYLQMQCLIFKMSWSTNWLLQTEAFCSIH